MSVGAKVDPEGQRLKNEVRALADAVSNKKKERDGAKEKEQRAVLHKEYVVLRDKYQKSRTEFYSKCK
jgi:hypothetical protein